MLTPIFREPTPWLRSFGRARYSFGEAMVHPDGRRLIAIEHDGTVTVWDLADGRQLHRLPAMLSASELDDARGVHLDLHPDGVRLFATVVITDTSDVAHCWNLDTGALIDRVDYPKIPTSFVGDRLALTAHGSYLTLWDLETGDTIHERLRDDASWQLLGARGDHALFAAPNAVELWNVRDDEMLWSAPATRAAAMCGDAILLASPGRLVLRELGGHERQLPCGALTRTDHDWTLAVDPDATIAVVAGAADELLAIELATGRVRWRAPSSTYDEVSIAAGHAVVLDGIHLVGSAWSLATGECRLRTRGALALSPDGKLAATCDGAHVRLWPLEGADHGLSPPAWTSLAAPEVPDVIVGLDRANHVHVTDHDGVLRHSWGPAPARSILDGPFLAHAAGTTITLLDATSGERVRTIEVPAAITTLWCAVPWLAIVTKTGEVCLHRPTGNSPPITFRTRSAWPQVLAVDATRVAIAAETSVELWRIDPPLRLHTFRSVTTPQCAAFDASGRWLVTGHWDGAVLIRDTRERTHHATLEATMPTVRRLAIRGDAIAIIGAGVAVWSLSTATRLGEWSDEDVLDIAWLDDTTVACATDAGLVLLRLA